MSSVFKVKWASLDSGSEAYKTGDLEKVTYLWASVSDLENRNNTNYLRGTCEKQMN